LLLPKRLNFPEREKNGNVNAQRTPRSRSRDATFASFLFSDLDVQNGDSCLAQVVAFCGEKKYTRRNKEKNTHERTRAHLNIPWLHVAEQWKENDDGEDDVVSLFFEAPPTVVAAPGGAAVFGGFLLPVVAAAKDIFSFRVVMCIKYFCVCGFDI